MFVRGSLKKKSRWQSVLHLTQDINSGNYTGAFNAIEKIKKGLSKHPQVAAVLKRQNEEIFEKVKCPHCEGEGCPKCEGKGYMADAVDKEDEPFLKDLIKNLRKGSATHSKQADDLEKAVKEEVELDEKFKVGDKVKVKKGSMKSPSQRHYEKTVGTIVKDFKDGDFKVNFGGNDNLSIDGKLLVKEEVELDEKKEPFAVVDTADGDKVVGTASDEKGAKSIISANFHL